MAGSFGAVVAGVVWGLMISVGCQSAGETSENGATGGSMPGADSSISLVSPLSRGEVVSHCRGELDARGFELGQLDAGKGVLTSLPRVSSQWFELGSGDLASTESALEASLQTIRRMVILEVACQQGHSDRVEIICRVLVQRWNRDAPMPSGSVHAMEVLDRTVRGAPTLRELDDRGVWVDLGRDPALEAAILKGIRQRLAMDSERVGNGA